MLKRLIALFGCVVIVFSLSACGSNGIATVDGENIDKEYFEYYFVEWKNMMQLQHGEDTWEDATLEGKPALEYVRERALQSVIEDKIIVMKAKADGINLTNDDVKSIDSYKQQWINEYGSEKAFLDAIMENYSLSEEQFDYMMEAAHYRNHIIDKYVEVNDAEVADYLGLGGKTNEEKVENLIAKIEELKAQIGIKKSIK